MHEAVTADFTEWAREAEPRVRRALTAAFGMQVGQDATAEAVSIAWSRWDDVSEMDNRLGYVYGIGRNCARRMSRTRTVRLPAVPEQLLPDVEPQLPAALADLPEKQRVVVLLVYGYGWSLSEAAELLGVSKSTAQKHSERGLARLRNALGVDR